MTDPMEPHGHGDRHGDEHGDGMGWVGIHDVMGPWAALKILRLHADHVCAVNLACLGNYLCNLCKSTYLGMDPSRTPSRTWAD